VDLGSAVKEWQTHGFVILPGFVPAAELKPALDGLPAMYPTAAGFHEGTDERRDRFTVDEWSGISSFPFLNTELSLLAVSDRVVDLAETLLADGDLRISSAEAWAKYTGAADYDQPLHRDYLNQTLMVPTDDPRHCADLARGGPLHNPPRLPPGPGRMGPADVLAHAQPRTRVVPVRAPGDAAAARALRIPAAWPPVLDRGHARRHGAAVSRPGYDPVAGLARGPNVIGGSYGGGREPDRPAVRPR
jgi:hypothetical protein